MDQSPLRSPARTITKLHVLAVATTLVVAFAFAMAPVANATTATHAWRARVGTAGANGTATINAYASGAGSVVLKLAKLKASRSHTVVISKGTCRSSGKVLVTVPSIRASSSGAANRTTSLTAAQVNSIKAATRGTGTIAIRIGYGSSVRCGLFAFRPTPLPSATPTPTPSATPTPTPAPTPSGGTLILVPFFMLAIPAGWSEEPSGEPSVYLFRGPGDQAITAQSVPSGSTLDEVGGQIISSIEGKIGADPEQTEAITLDGVPGRMLTYHFPNQGVNVHELDAFCVRNGRAYEITFANVAGTESTDRALFQSVIASFGFLEAGF